ncbi:hypothetical protein MA16_Dca016242 [Dendrobium catenatum]|uniref:Uncharacterized protein n=1 Tax=Dendrobium catenatum TaxID=906689 RepID=A0A2I0VVT5_9ASPA|nr:hypothetical protein MA16_Dca016242 [Dendrobium catenatum]
MRSTGMHIINQQKISKKGMHIINHATRAYHPSTKARMAPDHGLCFTDADRPHSVKSHWNGRTTLVASLHSCGFQSLDCRYTFGYWQWVWLVPLHQSER